MATEVASGIIASYAAAWEAHVEGRRRALLERAWAGDGAYCDPTALVEGREAPIAHIGGFHERTPGARIAPTTGVDAHGGHLRFGWRMLDPQATVALEAMDFGELGDDGRPERIVGFFGPFPPA
jgi:hypothetical protein